MYCTASDYVRLDSFLRGCIKLGYAGQSATVTGMFSEADDALFHRVYCTTKHTFSTRFCLIGYKLSTRFAPDLILICTRRPASTDRTARAANFRRDLEAT